MKMTNKQTNKSERLDAQINMLNEEQVWDLYSLENYNDPEVA